MYMYLDILSAHYINQEAVMQTLKQEVPHCTGSLCQQTWDLSVIRTKTKTEAKFNF